MKYKQIVMGEFVDRPNRFIAHVMVDGLLETVHVKNTGRCKELLLPGVTVALELCNVSSRKTKYDLICVYKEGLGWVNIDSMAPNTVVKEWLLSDRSPFNMITYIKPEYSYGKSRVDFYIEYKDNVSGLLRRVLLEVKGCTLEIDGEGHFPDAPTSRGVKHLGELTEALKDGYEAYIVFVIAMPKVLKVHPNGKTDPAFEKALLKAEKAGVKILNLPCFVSPDELRFLED